MKYHKAPQFELPGTEYVFNLSGEQIAQDASPTRRHRQSHRRRAMKTGATLKQFAKDQFFRALEDYKTALETGQNIVVTSLRIHFAKGLVPKSFHPLVGKCFRETKKQNP